MTIDIDHLFRLDGRTAIVTGGTRGIGLAIAEGFGAAGARVVVASRKPEACEATAAMLVDRGYDAIGVPTHLGSLDDIRRLVATTVDRFGAIDIVVNNAANALAEPIGEFSDIGFDKSIEVNVKGPVFLIQEALPQLRASEHASVINVVSAGAWLYSSFVAMYAAAKASMVSYTKSLAAGLAADGIRILSWLGHGKSRESTVHEADCCASCGRVVSHGDGDGDGGVGVLLPRARSR